MSLSTKILVFIFGLVILCLGGFLIYKQIETANKIADIQNSIVAQKQLLDNITRAQSQYATKDDIDAFAQQHDVDLNVIKQDLATLNAEISAISNISITSTGQVNSNVPSTSTSPGTNTNAATGNDPYGYMKNTQNLQLTEKFSNTEIPIGEVSFSAWRDKPWDLKISERKYSITSVLGVDSQNKHTMYSKFSIQVDGKNYDAKIDSSQFLEQYPQSTFKWFNPRLFLGMDGNVNVSHLPIKGDFVPNLSIGIMSYGKFDNQPDLSILQVGAGYGVVSKELQISISPIQYNLGSNIPLMHNFYIGPTIQLGTSGDIGIGAGVRVGM